MDANVVMVCTKNGGTFLGTYVQGYESAYTSIEPDELVRNMPSSLGSMSFGGSRMNVGGISFCSPAEYGDTGAGFVMSTDVRMGGH